MIYDPHETFNCNFPQEEWELHQKHEKTLELAEKVRLLINSGMVAVIKHSVLYDVDFDIKARVDYGAATLQTFTSAHWTALAISMLTRACFEPFEQEGVTRFYKSNSSNELFYHPNVEWKEDEFGRFQPVRKGTIKAEKMKQLELFEF